MPKRTFKSFTDIASSTWLNSVVGFLGIVVGIAGIVGVSLDVILHQYIYIIILAELLIIIVQYLSKTSPIVVKPDPKMISNQKLFDRSFELLTRDAFNQIKQMDDGIVTLHGIQVREAQTLYVDLYDDLDIPFIRAFDICSNPGLLLTRKNYHERNRSFVMRGGKINRLFIVDKESLQRQEFKSDLKQVLSLNEEIGVSVALAVRQNLTAVEVQDFICYGTSVVMVEGKQADEHYTFSTATVYFTKPRIDDYIVLFVSVWKRLSETSWRTTLES